MEESERFFRRFDKCSQIIQIGLNQLNNFEQKKSEFSSSVQFKFKVKLSLGFNIKKRDSKNCRWKAEFQFKSNGLCYEIQFEIRDFSFLSEFSSFLWKTKFHSILPNAILFPWNHKITIELFYLRENLNFLFIPDENFIKFSFKIFHR